MKKSNASAADDKWLEALGGHIQTLISKKGYKSPYEFWVQEIGDEVSRSTLNYILNGKVDVKITTLRKIAGALGVSVKDMLNF